MVPKQFPKLVSKSMYHNPTVFESKGGINMTYGYARVSTVDQSLDRQLDLLLAHGIDEMFTEKMTGTKKNRPELDRLLTQLKPGDTVVVESLSRLGRSTKNLIELVELFQSVGVHLVSLKEDVNTATPSGKLLSALMSAIAQFERDIIAERTAEGLKAARARGRMGGRPRTKKEKLLNAAALYLSGEYTIKEITEVTGVKKSSLYRFLKSNAKDV